jgi:hypothetical protein
LQVVTVLAALLLAPLAAQTHTLLQPLRHWRSVPVEVCVKSPGHVSITANDTDQGVSATTQALNGTHPRLAGTGWNTVPSVGTVVNASACGTPWQLGDGVPTIAFTEMIPGTCSGSCLAATFVGYYHCNDPLHPDGHCLIDDADVETRRNKTSKNGGPYYSLYESSCTSGSEWNIEGIMVHEVGHVLGLGHTNVSGATMYPSVSSCKSAPATIEADDASALDALY